MYDLTPLFKKYNNPSQAKVNSFIDICEYREDDYRHSVSIYGADNVDISPLKVFSGNTFSYSCGYTISVADEYGACKIYEYRFTRKYLYIDITDFSGTVEHIKRDNPFERINPQWYF